MDKYLIRKLINSFMLGFISFGSFTLFIPLFFILYFLLKNGLNSLSWNFFFELPLPVGETGGGMAHALMGTLIMISLASLIAIPWGIMIGIYLSEYSKGNFSKILRFTADLLNGTPSIVFGIFVYIVLVKQMKGFSALAGSIALAFIILPIIARSTEEILKLVPQNIRQAGLGIGLSRWKVILWIVVWGSRKNLFTGILLGITRAAGETAPLLFTAFGNMYFSYSLTQPMASLPVEIYNYAISPYQDWHELAWTGSLVLILLIFILNITSRIILNWDKIQFLKRVRDPNLKATS